MILDAVESLGFRCSGSLFAMNSYENRVYQIGVEEAVPVIAKFYRPGRWTDAAIVEEHEFALELNGLEIPVIAPLIINDKTLHSHNGFRFALFPRRGGRALELDNMEQLEQMAAFSLVFTALARHANSSTVFVLIIILMGSNHINICWRMVLFPPIFSIILALPPRRCCKLCGNSSNMPMMLRGCAFMVIVMPAIFYVWIRRSYCRSG